MANYIGRLIAPPYPTCIHCVIWFFGHYGLTTMQDLLFDQAGHYRDIMIGEVRSARLNLTYFRDHH